MPTILESIGLIAVGAIIGGGLVYLATRPETEKLRAQNSYCFRDLYSCNQRVDTQSKRIVEEEHIKSSLRNQVSQLYGIINQQRPNSISQQPPKPPKAPKLPYA